MTKTDDTATHLIDNCQRRFDAAVQATVMPYSVPSRVDTVEPSLHGPTAELFVTPHKKRLLAHARTYTQKTERPSLFCVISNGPPAKPVAVPDELLSVVSPLLTEEELPETVRLSRPLRLKEQSPIRRVETAHKEVPQKTCDFRVRRIPMPPQVRFADCDVPVSEVEEVLCPVFSDTSSERMAVLPFSDETIVAQLTQVWPRLSKTAQLAITNLVAK